MYILLFTPLVIGGWRVIDYYRQKYILGKVKTKSLKYETDCEYALYVLMELVKESLGER